MAGFRAWLSLGYCGRKGERCRIRVWARCVPSRKRVQAWRDAGADPAERPRAFYRLEAVFDTLSRDCLVVLWPQLAARGLGGNAGVIEPWHG